MIARRILLCLCLFAGLAMGQKTGDVLPPWSPGTLDIHHINTGKGDSALLIFPDGTTMLVDAGATWSGLPLVAPVTT